MRKFLLVMVALLALVSLSFAQIVNDGIRTRVKWESFALDSAQTDCTEVIFNLSGISEQGFATMAFKLDTTDTFSVWFQSGGLLCFGGCDTVWSDPVQCVFSEIVTSGATFGPLNIAFIQSEALVDTSDRKTGYMPLDYLKFLIDPAGAGLETIAAHKGVIKVWFK
jgi:hypothetical protein